LQLGKRHQCGSDATEMTAQQESIQQLPVCADADPANSVAASRRPRVECGWQLGAASVYWQHS